jgi:hypothetical protein
MTFATHPTAETPPLEEPRKLFRGLNYFRECGGFDGLPSPARCGAFNPEDDSVVALFPGKDRVYRFDLFGALCEKFRSGTVPLSVAWDASRREYLIGFADGTVRRFTARLAPRGRVALPGGLEPRQLAVAADRFFVADPRGGWVVAFDADGRVIAGTHLARRVCQIGASAADGRLAVGFEKGVAVLTPSLEPAWEVQHAAKRTAVAWNPTGDFWAGLDTGRLWRMAADGGKIADAPCRSGLHSLAAIEGGCVAATLDGVVSVHDESGAELGYDDLGTPVFHLGTTTGGLLALYTARGVTMVKPAPPATPRLERDARDEAAALLAAWEPLADSPSRLQGQVNDFLQRLDLARWPFVLAFQEAFLRRQEQAPLPYARLESALRLGDDVKADRLCRRTVPAVVDGSNVTRYHWNTDQTTTRRSRLAALLQVRDALAREANPVLYPLLLVVDVTERRTSDEPDRLRQLIAAGDVLETSSRREADALILNMVKQNGWWDCQIVTNDYRLFTAHAHMLPDRDEEWYRRVQRPFVIRPQTGEVYFPERSQ